MEMDLEVVPVLNKIDLPAADPERVAEEIEDIVGIDATDAVRCSAKTGVGVQDVLERLVRDIPCSGRRSGRPVAGTHYRLLVDNFLGVVSLIRIKTAPCVRTDKVRSHEYRADL